MHRSIHDWNEVLGILLNRNAVPHRYHVPPNPRFPPRPLAIRRPANTHLSPFLRRLDAQLHKIRPDLLAALIPSSEPILGLSIGRSPFTLQYATDGLGRDFEVLSEERGSKFLRLCLVQMAYAFHGVG